MYDPNGDHILGEQVLEVTAISSATISFTILDGTTVDTSAADWGTIGSGALLYEVYQVTSPYAIEDMPQTTFAQDIDKLYIAHDGYDPRELASLLDSAAKIEVRAGLHCAPRMHEALGTLSAGGTVRISCGHFTTSEEVQQLVDAMSAISGATGEILG